MTTVVRVEAHCNASQEVVVGVRSKDEPGMSLHHIRILQDGESDHRYAYGDHVIVIYEQEKKP